MLNTINRHERDARIEFQKTGHRYMIDGSDEGYVSVTSLVHRYFPTFHPGVAIDKMMSSSKWEQSKYYGKTKCQIKAEWNHQRDESSHLGNRLHEQIERYLLMEEKAETVEFFYFLKWLEFRAGWKTYRTEMPVFDEGVRVAGSIDCLFVDGDGKYYLVDWKRTKSLKMENVWEDGFGPFEGIDHCNYSHYSLQLNIYRYILKRHYGITVEGMYIVVLHPDNSGYVEQEVFVMEEVVEGLWKHICLV